MASHHLGAETSAQTHRFHSHHGLQGGLLRSPEPHLPPLNQAQQRACPCKVCWSHHSRLQQASSSPSCSKTPTSEINREYPCLQRQGLGFYAGETANFNEDCRYGFRPAHWPAQKPSHVPAPDHFLAPCRHSDPPYVPRSPQSPYVPRSPQSPYVPHTPQTDGTAMGAGSAPGTTPVASRFSPLSFNQGRDWDQKGRTMEPSLKGSGSYGGLPNQVILYSWFLIRCCGSSQGVEVSVGGFVTLGTAGTERFETGAIVQRLEKCRLLAHDGLEVRLAGLIDDCTTVSNGFSVDIVQAFLSGFPYTWNHLLNNEFRAPTLRHPDHQVSGSCGLDGGVEMEGVEKLDTSSSRGDQITNSNSTGLVEQEINNVSETTEEGQKENSHVDQSRCKYEKRPDRASKTQPHVGSEEDCSAHTQIGGGNALLNQSNGSTQPHVGSEEDCTAHTQIGGGNALLNQSNGSTEGVGELVKKSGKQEQKSNLSPRITRSMQKISRQAASSHNKSHISNGADTSTHCDSLNNCKEVHTPAEQCGSHEKVRSGTTLSAVFQERADKAYHRRSRTFSRDNNRDNTDGGKSSNMSPCYDKGSVVEMGAQRPEIPINVEASPLSKGEGHSINQVAFIPEAVQANDNGITDEEVQANDSGTNDEEGNILPSVQKSIERASFKSEEKFTKASQNELNKRESDLLSKSPGQGGKRLDIPPPLPRPRVPVSQRLISAAFGLKTSRSGRLLVPPLAHWRSQGLLRDKDGGIIAISDGSKDMSNDDTGHFKFKPPAEAGLKKLQKRLREVATDTPSKRRRGTKKRQ